MRRFRMGMIGGGPGAFIGPVHRIAAEMDREIELVAGVFSSNPARSRLGGESYRIDPTRVYADVATMLSSERNRDDGIDFVTIASPNAHHLPAARLALEAGIAVLSDKPATATLDEARQLAAIVGSAGQPYRLTYTYSGYPLVREARARIAAGEIGSIRKVVVEYAQGWLAGAADGKQAEWRVDPAQAGEGGAIADIGVHAFHLAEFVTGLRTTQLLADLASVVPGRVLDDDCQLLLRFDNGARGMLLASQIMIGERNGLRLRVYGDKGGMDWSQEQPNRLTLHHNNGRTEIIQAADASLSAEASWATRMPGGHPEGYLEAFANLYRDFARVLRDETGSLIPGIEDGLRGMALIHLSVHASRERAGWVKFEV
jgi:predicted dehydrogenase